MNLSQMIRRPAAAKEAANDPVGGITMNSLDLVNFINEHRRHAAVSEGAEFPSKGYAKLRHRDFAAKVPEVLGEGVCEKFRAPWVNPQNNQTYSIFALPKREACLMAMTYSYELQAKVFDRMSELEQAARFAVPTTLSGALRLAAEQAEQIEQQQALIAVQAPQVEALHRIALTPTDASVDGSRREHDSPADFRRGLSGLPVLVRVIGKNVYSWLHGGYMRTKAPKQKATARVAFLLSACHT